MGSAQAAPPAGPEAAAFQQVPDDQSSAPEVPPVVSGLEATPMGSVDESPNFETAPLPPNESPVSGGSTVTEAPPAQEAAPVEPAHVTSAPSATSFSQPVNSAREASAATDAPAAPQPASPLGTGIAPPVRKKGAFSLAGLTASPPSAGLADLPAATDSELPGTAAFLPQEVAAGMAATDAANTPPGMSPSGTVRRENPYHLGDLRRVWQEYVASLSHLPAVQALLDGMEVTVDDDHRVQLIVSNTIQEKYTSEHRDSMLQFLRQGLQNDLIDIEVQVSREAAAKVVYTPDERFAYLAEKNPLLHQMREIFQLDIE